MFSKSSAAPRANCARRAAISRSSRSIGSSVPSAKKSNLSDCGMLKVGRDCRGSGGGGGGGNSSASSDHCGSACARGRAPLLPRPRVRAAHERMIPRASCRSIKTSGGTSEMLRALSRALERSSTVCSSLCWEASSIFRTHPASTGHTVYGKRASCTLDYGFTFLDMGLWRFSVTVNCRPPRRWSFHCV